MNYVSDKVVGHKWSAVAKMAQSMISDFRAVVSGYHKICSVGQYVRLILMKEDNNSCMHCGGIPGHNANFIKNIK